MHPITATHPRIESQPGILITCPHTGIGYQPDPRPIDYTVDYFDKYVSYEDTPIARALNRARTDLVIQAIGLARSPVARTLIDIGIGSGEFIRHLSANIGDPRGTAYRSGITKVDGFDINPAGVQWLQEHSCFRNPYETRVKEQDIVTLWDTLEHMPEPDSFFDCLDSGTTLCTSLPIFQTLTIEAIQASRHYRPHEHLYYFTTGGFILWMERSGFDFLFHNDTETRAGRDSILSFAFRKR